MRENPVRKSFWLSDREAAGLVGDDAQAVVLEPHLVHQVGGADRVVGRQAADLDGVLHPGRDPARIDAVDVDVGARRRRDQSRISRCTSVAYGLLNGSVML